MAPLPQNNTGRVLVDYIANGRQHTVQFRYAGLGAPPSGFLEGVDDVLIAANGFMPTDWEFVGWRYSEQGSNITLPLAGAPTPFAGAYTPAGFEAPAFMSFVGRGTTGRRVRVYFLGAGLTPGDNTFAGADYRMTPNELATVGTVLTALEGSGAVDIAGTEPVWNPYANMGFNSYWQRKMRTS